jgi:hypothetical protein
MNVRAIAFPVGNPGTLVRPEPFPEKALAVTVPEAVIVVADKVVAETVPLVFTERSPVKVLPEGIVAP